MHEHQIMHRDMKPENILINEFKEAKITDFGSVRKVGEHPFENNRELSQLICTLYYRAPELLFCMKEYDEKVDIWSVGCIFAEMITGDILFKNEEGTEVKQLAMIFALCGNATEEVWAGVTKLPH